MYRNPKKGDYPPLHQRCPFQMFAGIILHFLYSFGELRKDKDFPTSVSLESIPDHLINLLYYPPRTDREGKIVKKLIQDSVYILEKRKSFTVEEILSGLTLPTGGTRRRRSHRNKSRRQFKNRSTYKSVYPPYA